MSMRSRIAGGLVCAALAPFAAADYANQYALFGQHAVTFQGYAWVKGGPVGTNGHLSTPGLGMVELDDLRVYGGLNLDPAQMPWSDIKAHGNVAINGDATLGTFSEMSGTLSVGGSLWTGGVSKFHGPVVAGGALTTSSYNTFDSNILAGGSVTIGVGTTVAGTTGSNGNVTALQSTTLTGTVTNPGTFSLGTFGTNPGGRVVGSVTVNPAVVTQVALPPAATFTSGGQTRSLNTFDDVTLAPGTYGALVMGGSTKVRLTGGDYYFDSITATGTFQDVYLDTTRGAIRIFVTGDVSFKRSYMYVNGLDYALDFDHQIDPSLAAGVYLESHGNVNLEGDFFGTIYTPYGDLTTGTIGSVTGSLIAGHDLTIGSANDVASSFVPSAYLAAATGVPEPSTAAVLLTCAGGAILRRRRR